MKIREMSLLPDARANLLCYLVAMAAATYALTSDWRVDLMVISCRSWLLRNRFSLPWLDRVWLGQLALQTARRDLRGADIALKQADVQGLFTGDMQLNQASTVVQRMLEVCRHALEGHRVARGWQ
jgi:hypothetical protein